MTEEVLKPTDTQRLRLTTLKIGKRLDEARIELGISRFSYSFGFIDGLFDDSKFDFATPGLSFDGSEFSGQANIIEDWEDEDRIYKVWNVVSDGWNITGSNMIEFPGQSHSTNIEMDVVENTGFGPMDEVTFPVQYSTSGGTTSTGTFHADIRGYDDEDEELFHYSPQLRYSSAGYSRRHRFGGTQFDSSSGTGTDTVNIQLDYGGGEVTCYAAGESHTVDLPEGSGELVKIIITQSNSHRGRIRLGDITTPQVADLLLFYPDPTFSLDGGSTSVITTHDANIPQGSELIYEWTDGIGNKTTVSHEDVEEEVPANISDDDMSLTIVFKPNESDEYPTLEGHSHHFD